MLIWVWAVGALFFGGVNAGVCGYIRGALAVLAAISSLVAFLFMAGGWY